MIDSLDVLAVLGQSPRQAKTPDSARRFVRTGIPARALDRVSEQFGFTIAEVQSVIGISPASAARKRGEDETLKPILSDRLYRMAAVFSLAKSVLEGEKKAAQWFREPNRALRGERPFDLLDTEVGTREVELVLQRIELGVYS